MNIKYESCLVTGGAGFIGCALSRFLIKKFRQVRVVDSLHPQIHRLRRRPAALAAAAELVIADVAEEQSWELILDGFTPDVVIHLAAETGTGQSLTEASRHAYVNVLGTTRMLDAFASRNIVPSEIIISSSRAVYGEGAWQTLVDRKEFYPGQRPLQQLESGLWDFAGAQSKPFDAGITRACPTSIYGATKLAQEHILQAWTTAFGTRLTILRLQNVYGPGQSLTNSYTGIVSLFCRLARDGLSIPLYEDGQMLRDFIYIDDVVSAFRAALGCTKPIPDIYDIGSGTSTTVQELATLIARAYAAPAPHVCGKFRHGDVRHASCVNTRTMEDLQWSPKISLEHGLTLLRSWLDKELD